MFIVRDRRSGDFYTRANPDGSRSVREFETFGEAMAARSYFTDDGEILNAVHGEDITVRYYVRRGNRYFSHRGWTTDKRQATPFTSQAEAEVVALITDGAETVQERVE